MIRANDRTNYAPIFGVWLHVFNMKSNKNHKPPVESCRDIIGMGGGLQSQRGQTCKSDASGKLV